MNTCDPWQGNSLMSLIIVSSEIVNQKQGWSLCFSVICIWFVVFGLVRLGLVHFGFICFISA
jgi:hypothetical protein